ncbi:hypothetical protein [uncultured Parolsenella sp.]|uniref:hypothetical protein n=1 Tax=uncultured Parolsenella sp. TaxID=2083008 RepID=UPI0026015A92|nr:hypothetical protein [uncultured Parolsenella sp.]
MADDQVYDNQGGVSELCDELGSELLGEALDKLATGDALSVVATALDASGQRVTCEFDDDSAEVCLEAARTWVRNGARDENNACVIGKPACYAIAYLGAVADDDDVFRDALILEFGDRGATCGYSAYVLVEDIGKGDAFRYTDPAPAGELACLL